MERLTARDPAGNAYLPYCEECGGDMCRYRCEHFDKVCEKLARYEEQGEQAEKLLAESEAARAELGRRLAAAQKMNAELTEAQATMVREFEAKLEELADTQRELVNANRNTEILAAELLDIRVYLDRKADYVKMNFGYSSQLSHEALQKAVWYTASKIVAEDRKMREQRGEGDSGGKSLEQYFRSCGFCGVPKDEVEKNRLRITLLGSIERMSMRACMVMGSVCRRVLERMEGEKE